MKHSKKILFVAFAVLILVRCGPASEKHERKTEKEAITLSEPSQTELKKKTLKENEKSLSSSAAVESSDTIKNKRKFIRTAELKFKVKNVRKITYEIEDITAKFEGFVTYTNLRSNIERTSVIPISTDSSLEIIYYVVENEMTVRVPNTKLDSILKEFAKLIDFLDYRIIKADDVSLLMLSNQLTEQRLKKYEQRVTTAIDNRGKKLNETTIAEETLLHRQEQADYAKVSTLSLQEQISYSTVKMFIYQRQSISRELIENDKNIESYKPNFAHRFWESVKDGWKIFEGIILFFTQIWGVLLIIIVIYFLYRKFLVKHKK